MIIDKVEIKEIRYNKKLSVIIPQSWTGEDLKKWRERNEDKLKNLKIESKC